MYINVLNYYIYIFFKDVQAVVKVMDRTGDGQIHFGEFCQGVKQILELCSKLLLFFSSSHK